MKKLIINLPVAVALAFCFTACSDNGSSITAPSSMCWDEQLTYEDVSEGIDHAYKAQFEETFNCNSLASCDLKVLTIHRCVDNVEFK